MKAPFVFKELDTPGRKHRKLFARVKTDSPWFKIFPNGFCPLMDDRPQTAMMLGIGKMDTFFLDHTDPSVSQEQIIQAVRVIVGLAPSLKPMDLLLDVATGKARFTILPDHVEQLMSIEVKVSCDGKESRE